MLQFLSEGFNAHYTRREFSSELKGTLATAAAQSGRVCPLSFRNSDEFGCLRGRTERGPHIASLSHQFRDSPQLGPTVQTGLDWVPPNTNNFDKSYLILWF